MKKSRIVVLIIVVITLIAALVFSMNNSNAIPSSSSVNEDAVSKANLTFSVLGDIHGNTGKLKIAIGDLYSINSNMDAMILNGDNVDEGLEAQYNSVEETFKNNKSLLPKIIIKNIGNHDYYDYSKGTNSPVDVEHFKKMYYDFSGEKSVYHDKWVKGYHFISLGSESGNTKELGTVNATLSQAQLMWLKEKLAENYKMGKPIFVFLHQHLSTSIKGWVGVVQRKELTEILSKYPEVILFTSHTHVLLSVDNVNLNQPYTTVHTGAVTYAILPDGYKIERLYNESQGLYVEVIGNTTTIKGRDFSKKTWVFSKDISK